MKDIIEEYLHFVERSKKLEKKEKSASLIINNKKYSLLLIHIVNDRWGVCLSHSGIALTNIKINGYDNALKYFNDLVKKYGGIK